MTNDNVINYINNDNEKCNRMSKLTISVPVPPVGKQ